MSHEAIGLRQLVFLLISLRTAIAGVQLETLQVLRTPDAWLAELAGFALGVVPVWWAARAASQAPPGQDGGWVGWLRLALGRWLGTAAAWLLVALFLFIATLSMRLFADLLTSGPMPETPTAAFVALGAALVAYGVYQGIEAIARVNEVLFPVAIALPFLFLGLGLRFMDASRLLPLLAQGPLPVLGASLTAAATSSTQVVVYALAPHVGRRHRLPQAVLVAAATAALAVCLTMVAVIAFFGARQASATAFPLYQLLRTITIMDFFERFDAVYLTVWTSGIYIVAATYTYAAATGLASLLGLRGHRPLALPLAALLAVGSLWVYQGMDEVQAFRQPAVIPLFYAPATVVLPFLLGVLGALRPRTPKTGRNRG